jgi:hypothetical protein
MPFIFNNGVPNEVARMRPEGSHLGWKSGTGIEKNNDGAFPRIARCSIRATKAVPFHRGATQGDFLRGATQGDFLRGATQGDFLRGAPHPGHEKNAASAAFFIATIPCR